MSVFVHAQGIKTVHAGGGGQKRAKFCNHRDETGTYPITQYLLGRNNS